MIFITALATIAVFAIQNNMVKLKHFKRNLFFFTILNRFFIDFAPNTLHWFSQWYSWQIKQLEALAPPVFAMNDLFSKTHDNDDFFFDFCPWVSSIANDRVCKNNCNEL